MIRNLEVIMAAVLLCIGTILADMDFYLVLIVCAFFLRINPGKPN